MTMPCQVMNPGSSCDATSATTTSITLAEHCPSLRRHLILADQVWRAIEDEARTDVEEEPLLRHLYDHFVLSQPTLESALIVLLASKLAAPPLMSITALGDLLAAVLATDTEIRRAIHADLCAAVNRDPTCAKMVHCFLYYNRFLALQAHRAAHRLWSEGRRAAALLLQCRVAEVIAVDIHPGARIGAGVFLDHATGVVIGETTVVGDGVSILHGINFGAGGGGAGEGGNRHPQIADGVLVGAGARVLGNVGVEEGARIAAGAVVLTLRAVPARSTVVGSPGRMVGGEENPVRMERLAALSLLYYMFL